MNKIRTIAFVLLVIWQWFKKLAKVTNNIDISNIHMQLCIHTITEKTEIIILINDVKYIYFNTCLEIHIPYENKGWHPTLIHLEYIGRMIQSRKTTLYCAPFNQLLQLLPGHISGKLIYTFIWHQDLWDFIPYWWRY